MEYGRITANQLEKADTGLPADAAINDTVLKTGSGNTKFYLGAPSWGTKSWVGKLYPPGSKDAQFLNEYVKHYNAVELNATHYKAYMPDEIIKWSGKATGNSQFKFCPKVWNQISHYSGFDNTNFITNQFLQGIQAFGDMLGPVWLQLSEKKSPVIMDKFITYLQSLPRDLLFFVEVRQQEWFQDVREYFFSALREQKIGAIITDTMAHREVLHMELTLPRAFIRFSCQGDHHTDFTRIDDWVQRIKQWKEKGLEECYFFVHAVNEALTPEVTRYVARQFNQECGAGLQEIHLMTLF